MLCVFFIFIYNFLNFVRFSVTSHSVCRLLTPSCTVTWRLSAITQRHFFLTIQCFILID